MPEYTQNDLPLVQECINSANRMIDHAKSEIDSWKKYRYDAEQRLVFWLDIESAIQRMERK